MADLLVIRSLLANLPWLWRTPLRRAVEEAVADVIPLPYEPGLLAPLGEPDPTWSWRANSVAERDRLEILAFLTVKHGPWEAASIAFHPINRRSEA
jgi:hypothetical protein